MHVPRQVYPIIQESLIEKYFKSNKNLPITILIIHRNNISVC